MDGAAVAGDEAGGAVEPHGGRVAEVDGQLEPGVCGRARSSAWRSTARPSPRPRAAASGPGR